MICHNVVCLRKSNCTQPNLHSRLFYTASLLNYTPQKELDVVIFFTPYEFAGMLNIHQFTHTATLGEENSHSFVEIEFLKLVA